ncbi:MAG: type III-A CRISPR-associated RAMP protein Csm3 [Desulfuromonadales bacterium]|nr:MAG: type III-A CRISPR-associated RAMP protein Csm3 [Desulfuromonadales bacterium]
MRFLYHKEISGIIRCESGLRVGAGKGGIEIGGVDNPVIRNPLDNFPYIPGSSLKGKLRSLLEWDIDTKLDHDGGVHTCKDKNTTCPICRIFGSLNNGKFGPARGIFRDSMLTEDSRIELRKLQVKKGLLYVEEKQETAIDRLAGKARGQTLRTGERVPAGSEFSFRIDYRVFDMGNGDNGKVDEENFTWLLHGLWLLERDALGACGGRGYGQISFGAEEGGDFNLGEVWVAVDGKKTKARLVDLQADNPKRKPSCQS